MSDRTVAVASGEGAGVTDIENTDSAPGASEPDEATNVTEVSQAAPAGQSEGAADEGTAVMADEAGEAATAGVPPDTPDGSAVAGAARRRPSRMRGALVWLLVLLSCLTVVITGVTWWAHYTVLNTSGYMKIVGPIGKDPEAIQSLSSYISSEIVQTTDLQQRIGDALPTQAQVLSGPINAYVEDFITKSAAKILGSPKAYQLWLKINEVGHEKIVAMLRGQTNGAYIQGSDVKLNLLPLISQVLVWVDQRLPGGLSSRLNPPVITPDMSPEQGIQEVADWSGRPLPSDFGQITLLQSDALGPAQTAVKWFDRLVWILPLITAALVALTIWLSRRRGRTAIAIGVGAAVAIFVTRVIILRASEYLTTQVKQGTGQHLLRQVVDASLGPLTTITIWVCVIGVVAAVLVWALGRRDVRAGVAAAGKRITGQAADLRMPESPVTSWILRHLTPVRWGMLVAGLIALALVTSSWLGIVLAVVVELLLQGVLSLLAGQWPFAQPAGDRTGAA
jgi:hypothetical protein